MVKFEFTLTDHEAEALLDGIQREIVDCMVEVVPGVESWYSHRIVFLQEMKKKILDGNSRVA